MEKILIYKKSYSQAFEKFRQQTFEDGNTSLTYNKIDPNNFDGKIWIVLNEDKIVSCMALENDHYTSSPDVARVCRYHIIKSHRHGRYGFKMLDHLIQYAKSQYKLIYWTHDVSNRALNALYQHKKVFTDGLDNSYFYRPPFSLLKLEERFLFKVSDTDDLLQKIYYFKFDESFVWTPTKKIVWQK